VLRVAILAERFLAFFDGFSIGSNDLTQLTLGLDRDSGLELLAADFDERDPAVTALISQAIQACLAQGKYIGICGQGPSGPGACWCLANASQILPSAASSPSTAEKNPRSSVTTVSLIWWSCGFRMNEVSVTIRATTARFSEGAVVAEAHIRNGPAAVGHRQHRGGDMTAHCAGKPWQQQAGAGIGHKGDEITPASIDRLHPGNG
jgi:hypothetical protein